MSISLYTGTPGSGKSYHCTKMIYEYLKKGKNVISNFPIIVPEDITGFFVLIEKDSDLSIEFLYNFAKANHSKGDENLTLIVIDEAQLRFNSRDWANKDRAGWNSFFSVHRHLGYEIVLSTQNADFIDKQMRVLVECEYKHKNLKKTKLGLLFPFMPTWFMIVQFHYSTKMKMGVSHSFYDKKIGARYDSYVFFDKLLGNVEVPEDFKYIK